MMFKLRLAAAASIAAFAVGATAVPLTPAIAGMPVFDATNYTQNLLQAARALDLINNQIKSLQNQATMIENMARNLKQVDFPQLVRMRASLAEIDQLMAEAKGIQFDVKRLDQQFASLFPGAGGADLRNDERVRSAQERLANALEGFRHNMRVQSKVVATVREDAETLRELSETSQSATGSLQAQQAASQLLALSTKQQFQIQELLASEFRSEALERARRAQEREDAQDATRRFLGRGSAYTPGQ